MHTTQHTSTLASATTTPLGILGRGHGQEPFEYEAARERLQADGCRRQRIFGIGRLFANLGG